MAKKFWVCYLIAAVGSWFLISGWMFANLESTFPGHEREREQSGFCSMWSLPMSAGWPLGIPLAYCLSGYAEHGWRPVWDLKERSR